MMEYAPGGELFVRLAECGSYTEHEAKPIFAQIASAVQYMVIFLDIDYYITFIDQSTFIKKYWQKNR